MSRILRIGTRGSRLALWQAEQTAARLAVPCEIRTYRTAGDADRKSPPHGQSSAGFFTAEIEQRLLGAEVDLAVHSLKDLPTETPGELIIGAVLARGAVSDLLLVAPAWHEEGARLRMKAGCSAGTASLRRQALLAFFDPTARAELVRGNVPTRVRLCREGTCGAVILARAGIERLDLDTHDLFVYELAPEHWIPAPGQGAVAVQVRRDDEEALAALRAIDDAATHQATDIERGLMARAGGGCHSAFGALARPEGGEWRVIWGLTDGQGRWATGQFRGGPQACLQADPAKTAPAQAAGAAAVSRRYGLWS